MPQTHDAPDSVDFREPRAIREQLAELHDSAFGWAMVCCQRNREMAAEVLQQAYCRILSGEARFHGRSGFSTWVFGVIRHVALEERRHQSCRQRLRPLHTACGSHDRRPDSGQQVLEQQEMAAQLAAALQELSARQRQLLHLTFYEGMTIEQAAGVLEISVGSARQHYQRGKAALKRLLAADQGLEQ